MRERSRRARCELRVESGSLCDDRPVRMQMKHCKVVATATACVLLLPACVQAYDATIANPCGAELSVESYRVPPDEVTQDERVARFRLAAEEITTVEGVFDEAAGERWTLLVEDTDFEIEVSKEQVEDETILIPASACPQS